MIHKDRPDQENEDEIVDRPSFCEGKISRKEAKMSDIPLLAQECNDIRSDCVEKEEIEENHLDDRRHM